MPANPIHSCERYTAPPGATLEMLIEHLDTLLLLNDKLRQAKYTIRKEEGLIDSYVLPGIELFQILYTDIGGITRDTQRLLQLAIDQSVPAIPSDLEAFRVVGKLGPWNEDLVGSIDTFDAWLDLLRKRLKIYEGDAEGFFVACRQAFPDFVFSSNFPNCLETFEGNLNDFIPEVVSALISLANHMSECMKQPSTDTSMKAFTAKSGYETSMEGDAKRKDDLTFEFSIKKKDGNKELKILCEPHIKLHRSARLGDNTYYQHRIYFSTAVSKHDELKGKTLIGHIGKHL